MPPFDLVMISDDEEFDPQKAFLRDMALLDEKISKANAMVKELDDEVSTFVALLRTAQDRLHKTQEWKEKLIDEKQQLLEKKLKLLESKSTMGMKREVTIKSNAIEVSPTVKASPAVLSSYPTYAAPTPTVRPPDNHTPDHETDLERRASSRAAPNNISPRSEGRTKPSMGGRGRGSRRSYGGNLSGIRRGASISGRNLREQQPQSTLEKRRAIYSPYWEASDSDSGVNPGRASIALATEVSEPQDIPTNPKTHSRIEISSIIGGKTQGTWCSVSKATSTVYNAGSYMALDRTLNHLLPKYPEQGGGVYVGDWLRKEVGKIYQIFIKRSVNHWLYYGKYQIASIREVSLEEWVMFNDADKNRWAEHMLEHQWGKMILQKKKLLTEEQCTKSNWKKVLGLFNRGDDQPRLRLKLLELKFICYDRDLYDALCRAPTPKSAEKNKRKWTSSEEGGDDDDDDDFY